MRIDGGGGAVTGAGGIVEPLGDLEDDEDVPDFPDFLFKGSSKRDVR